MMAGRGNGRLGTKGGEAIEMSSPEINASCESDGQVGQRCVRGGNRIEVTTPAYSIEKHKWEKGSVGEMAAKTLTIRE